MTTADALTGAVVGAVATVPMTALMEAGFRELPCTEQYPLPPRQITMNVAAAAGVEPHLTSDEKWAATLLAHFAYGGTCGLAYSVIVPPEQRGAGSGVVFGLGVWAGSYLGWLPATGLLSSATRHPIRRTALMIAAHIVWGAAVGTMAQGCSSQRSRS